MVGIGRFEEVKRSLIEETNEVVSKVVQTDDLDGIEMLKLNLFHTQESFNECLIEPGFYETGYSISRDVFAGDEFTADMFYTRKVNLLDDFELLKLTIEVGGFKDFDEFTDPFEKSEIPFIVSKAYELKSGHEVKKVDLSNQLNRLSKRIDQLWVEKLSKSTKEFGALDVDRVKEEVYRKRKKGLRADEV